MSTIKGFIELLELHLFWGVVPKVSVIVYSFAPWICSFLGSQPTNFSSIFL